MTRGWALLLVLALAACGVDGPPAPPGSGLDPRDGTAAQPLDPDGFFR